MVTLCKQQEAQKTEPQSNENSWWLLIMSSCGSSSAGQQRHICLFGKRAWEIKIHFRSLCSDSQGPCWKPITLQFEQLRRPTGCFPHPIAAQGAGCSADRHTWARPASHCERFAGLMVFVLAVRRTLMVGSLALEWQINLELHLAKNFGLGELDLWPGIPRFSF